MRIALVTETLFTRADGVSNRFRHLLDHLEGHGHDCLVIAPQGSPAVYGHTPVFSLNQAWQTNTQFPEVGRSLADFQPDLVHIFHPINVGVEAMRQARHLGLPVVASYDSDLNGLSRQWGFGTQSDLLYAHFRVLHNLADISLMPSYFSQMQLRDMSFDRVGVWKRGVDCDLFSPRRRSAAWRQHLSDGEPRKPLMIFAGQLAAEKRIELLKNVIEQNSECRLAIVGAGPEGKWLKEYFDGTPTVFTGYLDQGDLAEAYASADLFIHPASNDISGTSALEAMASGLPVLAPHSCSLLDFAVHGENALLFPSGDSEQASAYVQKITSSPRLAADLSRIARQTALAHSWESTLESVLKIYTKVLENHPSPVTFPAGNFQSLPLSQVHS